MNKFVATLFLLATLAACRQEVATPRPMAFPRVATCDTIYRLVDQAVIPIEVNAAANVEVAENGRWVNVDYPSYNGRLALTLGIYNRHDSINAAVENRIERMSINVGDFAAEQTSIDSPLGIHSVLLTTQAHCVTPLQFISTDRRRFLVSGSFSFNGPVGKEKSDSLSPVIDALRTDILHLINNLKTSTPVSTKK